MNNTTNVEGGYIGEAPAPALVRSRTLGQIVRFVAVGIINTALDFGVLNIVSYLTGIHSGRWLWLVNAPGFVIALINSYLLNKYWTFQAKGGGVSTVEFGKFASVSVIGLLINTSVLVAVTTFFPPVLGLGPQQWENVAKVIATGFSLVWNFTGYKYIVFGRKERTAQSS